MTDFSWMKHHLGKPLFLGLTLAAMVIVALQIQNEYAFYAFILLAAIFFSLLLFYRTNDSSESMKSEAWFKIVSDALSDCSHATIYLRDFSHPEQFKEIHREQLTRIMKMFAEKIVEQSENFHIIAFRSPHLHDKDPLGWIKAEILERSEIEDADELISKCIRIIDRQPTANSTTVYMIDNSILLYNRKNEDNELQYYRHEVGRTVIPFFFNAGLLSFKLNAED